MKVLLCRNYGSHHFDNELKRKLSQSRFPKNRIGDVVSYIDTTGEYLHKESNGYWVRVGNEMYFIAEVDTSRPWTILEYDGSEYIQYLDYKVINEDMNYCSFIN